MLRFFSAVFFIGTSLLITGIESYAANNWCIGNPLDPPCGGAPGKCTKNADGSPGGFVATTANVEKTSHMLWGQRNVPFIDRFAQVCDTAQISGRSRIVGWAVISGNARIAIRATVADNAQVMGNTRVYENAVISGHARIHDSAQISGDAHITDYARILSHALIYGNAQISDEAIVGENAQIFGHAVVYERARIHGRALISGNTHVFGDANITGSQNFSGNDMISGLPNSEDVQMNTSEPTPAPSQNAIEALDQFLSTYDVEHPVDLKNKPIARNRDYTNSEAEVLINNHSKRIHTKSWQNSVCLNNKTIGIEAHDIPPALSKAFIIRDPGLAHQTGLCVGDALSQNQLQEHPQVETLTNALMDPHLIEVNDAALNPVYNPRTINKEEQAYIDYLRSEIKTRLDSLNKANQGYYNNPRQAFGSLFVNGLADPMVAFNTQYHSKKFLLLSDAIKNNKEKDLIENLVKLATLFDKNHAEAKSAFIDVFTTLFVTKNFPSEGTRQSYFHFILRCGQIH